jgi:DNA-directed RNA polymerase subunit RPC12/RpoP
MGRRTMMSDLIKREDAIGACAYETIECYEARKAIRALPSADRPQGEWIRTGRTNIYGGIEVQCSNCGDRVMVQHLEDEWYCRHCGADMGMKGADDDDEV